MLEDLKFCFKENEKNMCIKVFDGFNHLNETETAKLIPEELITYKVFGEPGGPHYAHFDVVGGRLVRLFYCSLDS